MWVGDRVLCYNGAGARLERSELDDMEEVFREALNLSKKGEPYVIATVVDTKGSTPQKPGAKLLVREDGSGVGTLGGGCVEGDIWFNYSVTDNHSSGRKKETDVGFQVRIYFESFD